MLNKEAEGKNSGRNAGRRGRRENALAVEGRKKESLYGGDTEW